MIKFFRKIRQKLLTEYKLRKYLIYAIGEIFLVVIGILIALQVNNINQLSKERKEEQKFLKQIRADLNLSHFKLKKTAEFFTKQAFTASYVTQSFWNPKEIIMDSLIKSLGNVLESRREKPLIGTMESLVNSGEINIIHSDSLRNAIITYLGIVGAKLSDIERYDETYYRPAVNKIAYKINYSEIFMEFGSKSSRLNSYPPTFTNVPFKNDYNDFLKDSEIYTNYNQLLVAHRNQAYRYQELAEESKKLSNRIGSYLEQYE